MKRTFLAIGLALAMGTASVAKTPKEVLEPYKAYRAALADKNPELAMTHAYDAWQKAEELMGDHKTTGDLAQNYADIRAGDKITKAQIKAMQRAVELASEHGDDAVQMHLERAVKLAQYQSVNGSMVKARKTADKYLEYAKENGQSNSVFYGELLTIKAETLVRSRRGKKLIEITDEALAVFESPDEVYPSAYPILAHLYNGFGHEYEQDVLEAALSYQKVMEYVGELDYGTHPIVGRALGRWSHMRARLQTAGEFEVAQEKGLCDCWPYNVERNESVEPIKRLPPRFTQRALRSGVSGYTIVQFDLDDDGNVINAKSIVSWPPDLYEETSLTSLSNWKYSAKQPGETEMDRKNLISTIRYQINDRNGNPVY